MDILVENCSSPGASFTDNTNNVILKCYDLICEDKKAIKPFRQFRRELSSKKGVNDNNARNIFPFLKNCGLVTYEPGNDLNYSQFFTKNGLAYVQILQIINQLNNLNEYPDKQAHEQAIIVKKELIYQGVLHLLTMTEANYKYEFKLLIKHLIEFGMIDKNEYAYMLYMKDNLSEMMTDEYIAKIKEYRDGNFTLNVQVKVKNDLRIREATGQQFRNESISFLTSYTYFIALLSQMGFVEKIENGYYALIDSKINRCKMLLKEVR